MTKPVRCVKDLGKLKAFTPARIGLARAGSSMATQHILNFDLDHARARDAVHLPFNTKEIQDRLSERNIQSIQVSSAAPDRATYLQRPDLGQQLDPDSKQRLQDFQASGSQRPDLVIIIADGLSTTALHTNAIPFLDQFLSLEPISKLHIAPIVIATQSRVALADEIGAALSARLSIILIGERPGLSAADSMGIYMTFDPKKGRTDAQRNCISNVRPGGLGYADAARELDRLISGAFQLKLSGVNLKTTALLSSPRH